MEGRPVAPEMSCKHFIGNGQDARSPRAADPGNEAKYLTVFSPSSTQAALHL
jgi:hypothetical protein